MWSVAKPVTPFEFVEFSSKEKEMSKITKEIDALKKIVEILSVMNPPQRQRVIRFVMDKFNVKDSNDE